MKRYNYEVTIHFGCLEEKKWLVVFILTFVLNQLMKPHKVTTHFAFWSRKEEWLVVFINSVIPQKSAVKTISQCKTVEGSHLRTLEVAFFTQRNSPVALVSRLCDCRTQSDNGLDEAWMQSLGYFLIISLFSCIWHCYGPNWSLTW